MYQLERFCKISQGLNWSLQRDKSSAKILNESLSFLTKILDKNEIIFYKFEIFILGKFWTGSWSKIHRINHLRIPIDLLVDSCYDPRVMWQWLLPRSWNSTNSHFFHELRISPTIHGWKLVMNWIIFW